MGKAIHKGNELRNVSETWDENERRRQSGNAPGREGEAAPAGNNLDQVIREEAAEYDNANKEERLLDGERATVSDEQISDE